MHHVLYFHHATTLGGAPRSLALLLGQIDNARFKATVTLPDRHGNEHVAALFANCGAEVIQENHLRPFHGSTVARCDSFTERLHAIAAFLPTAVRSMRIIKMTKPDLIHLNSTCLPAVAFGARLARTNAPIVAHIREPLLSNRWGRLLAGLNRLLVDHFISIDQYGLASLGLSDTSRSEVVFNSAPKKITLTSSETREANRKKIGLRPEDIVFLSLSRIAQSNGAIELSRLVCNCESDLPPNVHFVIAGFQQPLSPYAAQAFDLINQSSRLTAVPFCNEAELLIDACDAIIAPFTTPHNARSVLEGAAAGKPSFITNLPNLVELIIPGTTGFIFDLSLPEQFVELIQTFSSDRELRKSCAQACREKFLKDFDQTTNAKAVMRCYDNLLGNHEEP